jgi:hypothetical protein
MSCRCLPGCKEPRDKPPKRKMPNWVSCFGHLSFSRFSFGRPNRGTYLNSNAGVSLVVWTGLIFFWSFGCRYPTRYSTIVCLRYEFDFFHYLPWKQKPRYKQKCNKTRYTNKTAPKQKCNKRATDLASAHTHSSYAMLKSKHCAQSTPPTATDCNLSPTQSVVG